MNLSPVQRIFPIHIPGMVENPMLKGWIKKRQFTFSIIVNNVMVGNVSLNIPLFPVEEIYKP